MENLAQITIALNNLISEEVKKRTATLESEKRHAEAIKCDYSHYIRLIVKEYNIDLDAQVKKLQNNYEHSQWCDGMAGRHSASPETFDLSLALDRWKTIKKICEGGLTN